MKKALSLILAVVMMLAIAAVPVMADDEVTSTVPVAVALNTGKYTTLTDKPTPEIAFICNNGWTGDGFEAAWGIGLLPADTEYTNPADVATWYNCGNDENVKVAEDGSTWDTTWGFPWPVDANGDTTFQVMFQIPEAELAAAGFETMYDAAAAGRLVGYIKEVVGTENDGIVVPKPGQLPMKGNCEYEGKDAIMFKVVTDEEYYAPDTPDTPDTPDAPQTGDATLAAVAIAAVASMGAVLVIGKKRA